MRMPRGVIVAVLAVAGGAFAPAVIRAAGELSAAAGPAPATTRPAALPFAPGEEIDLDIDFRHVHSGKARLTVGRPEGSIWPMIWTARSDGVASIFDVRVHYVSYWDPQSGLARGSDLNAIEVNDRHTDRIRFERDAGRALVAILRKGELRERTSDVPPDAQEAAGALLRVRTLPLAPGAHLEYPVFNGYEVATVHADVDGRETLDTPAGRFDTLRVAIRVVGVKGRFESSRPSYVWVSADDRRIPVRMSGDFSVGTITATLAAYRPGGSYFAKP